MPRPIEDREELRWRDMKTPMVTLNKLRSSPKKLSINNDGKVHRKNRKRNMERVVASGKQVTVRYNTR